MALRRVLGEEYFSLKPNQTNRQRSAIPAPFNLPEHPRPAGLIPRASSSRWMEPQLRPAQHPLTIVFGPWLPSDEHSVDRVCEGALKFEFARSPGSGITPTVPARVLFGPATPIAVSMPLLRTIYDLF